MKKYEDDPFFRVPQKEVEITQGVVKLPLLFYDATSILTFFSCDPKKIENLLEGTPYKSGLKLFGKSLIALGFYEYRDTSYGSYNEVGLAIPVIRKEDKKPLSNFINCFFGNLNTRKIGYYIIDLPVTTELSRSAGKEIWGYPKFVTNIPFSNQGRNLECSVMDPDTKKPIMTFSGKIGIGVKFFPISLLLYSKKGKEDIRASVNVRGWAKLSGSGSCKLTLGDSNHKMAIHLQTLGINNSKPLLISYNDKFQYRINEGTIIR